MFTCAPMDCWAAGTLLTSPEMQSTWTPICGLSSAFQVSTDSDCCIQLVKAPNTFQRGWLRSFHALHSQRIPQFTLTLIIAELEPVKMSVITPIAVCSRTSSAQTITLHDRNHRIKLYMALSLQFSKKQDMQEVESIAYVQTLKRQPWREH